MNLVPVFIRLQPGYRCVSHSLHRVAAV